MIATALILLGVLLLLVWLMTVLAWFGIVALRAEPSRADAPDPGVDDEDV